MDSNVFLPYRKRGMIFLITAVVILILGQTVLRSSLTGVPFVLYWTACFVFTGLAIVFAFLDVAGVQRHAREQQRELLEKTITEIARQKEIRAGRSNSGRNPQ
jgi:membrane protein implicated in regulation of membrane protease activity